MTERTIDDTSLEDLVRLIVADRAAVAHHTARPTAR